MGSRAQTRTPTKTFFVAACKGFGRTYVQMKTLRHSRNDDSIVEMSKNEESIVEMSTLRHSMNDDSIVEMSTLR